jgi:thymidylate synthase ThyX
MKSRMRVELLDHGYCEAVETWGCDERIIESARMSTHKSFLGWGFGWHCTRALCDWKTGVDAEGSRGGPCPRCGATELVRNVGDEKLLRTLWENKHSTPFEFAGLTVEVQAPIMVFREWHRHRVPFGYSELSARYTPMPDVNYMPSLERMLVGTQPTGWIVEVDHEGSTWFLKSGDGGPPGLPGLTTTRRQVDASVFPTSNDANYAADEYARRYGHSLVKPRIVSIRENKQAGPVKGSETLTEVSAVEWAAELDDLYKHSQRVYESGLRRGVPKELARLPVTVGRYSRMRATGNLRGWCGFLGLRMAPGAQFEIRVFAHAVHDMLAEAFPRTMALFDEKRPT